MTSQLRSQILCSIVVLALAVCPGVAQKVANTGPKYDVAHQVKIQGTVEEVREVPGDYEGTHLVVKTDQGLVLVQVAPTAFLKEMDTSYKKGDIVQVVGAKTLDATEEQVLAREITIGADTVTLRDDKGVPVWAGWKPAKASAH
jgi:hypothetical protein